MTIDYGQFYDLEKYLFGEVHKRFAKTGKIRPIDFYFILTWKANRAKMKALDRLDLDNGGFHSSVVQLARSLRSSNTSMCRLKMLMTEYGFRLPTATAILAVLYPTSFTVYDVRVSEQLGRNFKKSLAHRKFSTTLWNDYQKFLEAVQRQPVGRDLREKDRYLWGRSLYKAAERTINSRRKSPPNRP